MNKEFIPHIEQKQSVCKKWYTILEQKFLKYQFVRFVIVGGTATVIDFALYIGIMEIFGYEYYLIAATIGFIFGGLFNFFLSKHWTFQNKSNQHVKQYGIFLIIAVTGLALNNGLLYVGVEYISLHPIIARMCATAIVMFWNFFLNKYVTFKHVGESHNIDEHIL